MAKLIKEILLLTLTTIISSSFSEIITSSPLNRTFSINHTANAFFMDNQPFRYVSGSLHYFRVPHQYWRDRIRKFKAAGLNAVCTYIEWSLHEPSPGVFDFSGQKDIRKFIETAEDEGLYVILRPGPYICAERDMGGLPSWLLGKYPNISLRTTDVNYMQHVKNWLDRFFDEISNLMYGNGGPVILIQVENEYGSYNACDREYGIQLRDIFHGHMDGKAVSFTTDGGGTSYLTCGKIPGVYATVDFGPGGNVENAFNAQRSYEPTGPLVNSEYYSGWLAHWGRKLPVYNTTQLIDTLKKMLEKEANVNFYVFHGGTNFDFSVGANYEQSNAYTDITTYYHNAPITEAGDLTPVYFKIKETLKNYMPICGEKIKVEAQTQKGDYGEVTLSEIAKFLSPQFKKYVADKMHQSKYPLSFELLGQRFGYLLYETIIPFNQEDALLKVEKSNDVGNVYLKGVFKGNISRNNHVTDVKLGNVRKGDILSIAVENLGRINYGVHINDTKGILSQVYLNSKVLRDWNMTSFELGNIQNLNHCTYGNKKGKVCLNGGGYTFYLGTFKVPEKYVKGEYPLDSFLDVSRLTKGVVFVNGYNLGRYWSTKGPQYSIYVPGCYLKKNTQDNELVIMDEFLPNDKIKVKFIKEPIFHD